MIVIPSGYNGMCGASCNISFIPITYTTRRMKPIKSFRNFFGAVSSNYQGFTHLDHHHRIITLLKIKGASKESMHMDEETPLKLWLQPHLNLVLNNVRLSNYASDKARRFQGQACASIGYWRLCHRVCIQQTQEAFVSNRTSKQTLNTFWALVVLQGLVQVRGNTYQPSKGHSKSQEYRKST